MQFLAVLRGCLGAYAAGVALILMIELFDSHTWYMSWSQVVGMAPLAIIYGAIFMAPVIVIIMLIWAVLAKLTVRVPFWVSLLIAGISVVIVDVMLMGAKGLHWALLCGVLIGCAFWLAAFGTRRSEKMHFGTLEDVS